VVVADKVAVDTEQAVADKVAADTVAAGRVAVEKVAADAADRIVVDGCVQVYHFSAALT